ncbi:MAG: peptide MFS transporter [Pseudomonadota bacterium]|nr:peptide MFS transporter [Pseudomonadota bacterium]
MISTSIAVDKRRIAFCVLFLTEMWERFSCFGLRALLVLYFVQVWHWTDQQSYAVFGVYITLMCLTPVLGGYLSDRVLGRRYTSIVGGCLIMLGHLCITFLADSQFMLGLTNIIVGTGLMVPSMCSLVGMLYAEDKPRHDRAFTLFYMGINIGGILAGVVVGLVAHQYGWHAGFSLAAIGMFVGLLTFLFGWRYLALYISEPHLPQISLSRIIGVVATLSLLMASCCYLLTHPQFIVGLVVVMLVLSVLLFAKLLRDADTNVKSNLWILIMLYALTVGFFIMYEQSGTSMMLFTERVIDRNLWGFSIPTPVLSALNPIYIILFAPVTAALWIWLAARRREPHVILKVAVGIILSAIGFLALAYAASIDHPNLLWLALAVFLSAIGELFIGPVILAAVSELAPPRFNSTLMGIWFMMGSIASYLAAGVAKLTSVSDEMTASDHYEQVFRLVGYNGLAVGIVTILIYAIYRYRYSLRYESLTN